MRSSWLLKLQALQAANSGLTSLKSVMLLVTSLAYLSMEPLMFDLQHLHSPT